MVTDAYGDRGMTGLKINFRTDDALLNLRSLKVKIKINETTITELLCAGDCE
jgi:hypothetical protein